MSIKARNLSIVLAAVLIVLALVAGPRMAGSASPLSAPGLEVGTTVPYYGQLNNDQGGAAADGLYDFRFALYGAETGGEPLWSEAQAAVPVKSGMFALSLGSAVPIPEAILGRRGQWLEIEVRGPVESEYATLAPRHLLSLGGLTAPSSPSADAACAHDHIGETWNATANWSAAGFKINNNGTGPAVWVVNTGGGNALRGDGYGTSIGVFGEGANAPGIVGHGISSDGVEGNSDGSMKSGVYAHHEGEYFGYGVYATSNNGRGVQAFDGGPEPDDSYAVYAEGDIKLSDDLTVDDTLNVYGYASFSGGKTGFVVDVAQNDEAVPLQSGDLVANQRLRRARAGRDPGDQSPAGVRRQIVGRGRGG